MKRFLVIAAIASFSAVVSANVSGGSSAGSQDVSKGMLGSISTSAIEISGSGAKSIDLSKVGFASLERGSVYVINSPSKVLGDSSTAVANGLSWVFTKSGDVLILSGKTILASAQSPIETSKGVSAGTVQFSGRLLTKSGQAIEFVVDSSGRVSGAASTYLKETFGPNVSLVMKGVSGVGAASGEGVSGIATASKDALIVVGNGAGGSVSKLVNGSVKSVQLTSAELQMIAKSASTSTSDAFAGSFERGTR